MLAFVYHALVGFRSAFTRRRSWLLFCAVVVSFLAVTSGSVDRGGAGTAFHAEAGFAWRCRKIQ